MDARGFAMFLKEKLLEKAEDYDEILYSVSYSSMEEGTRIAGIRTTLVSIADSLGDLVSQYQEGNI